MNYLGSSKLHESFDLVLESYVDLHLIEKLLRVDEMARWIK